MSIKEKARAKKGEQIYYDDPKYIEFINEKTSQHFKIEF